MRPNNTIVAEVESTFTGEDVDMEASAEDLAHLMGILSDIYSNPTEAVVREYIVNAIDSHVEAGTTRPVEVTPPGPFSPNLIIKDFGVGMSADDIRKVYSKYGKSTKRNTDLQSGMLGIGAKSAFAYSNGFLVTGIKDGIKTSVSVNRSDDGGGVMTILAEVKTSEPNGVTVSIPVSNTYELNSALNRFCSFLPAGVVLVDGEDLSRRSEWELVASDIEGMLDERYEDENGKIRVRTVPGVVIKSIWRVPEESHSRIIMGNVPYAPNQALTPHYNSAIYAEIVMGAAVFEPSRESLKDSALTRRTEALIKESYIEFLSKGLNEQIDEAPSKPAARALMVELSGAMRDIGVDTLQYKGEAIPGSSSIAFSVPEGHIGVQYGYIQEGYGSLDRRKQFSFQTLDELALIITDAPEHRKPGPVFRQRIVNYIKRVFPGTPSYGYKDVILVQKGGPKIENEWIDLSSRTVSWDVIKKEEIDRTRIGGGGVSTAGKHFVINKDGTSTLREIDDDEDIVYVNGSTVKSKWALNRFVADNRSCSWNAYDTSTYQNFMKLVRQVVDEDVIIIDVYANRLEKFLRDYPEAKPLTWDDVDARLVKHITTQVTDADILHCLHLDRMNHLDLLPDADDDAQYLRGVGKGGDKAKMSLFNKAVNFGDKDFNERHQKIMDECNERIKAIHGRYPLLAVIPNYVNRNHSDIVRKHLMIEFLESQEDKNDSV